MLSGFSRRKARAIGIWLKCRATMRGNSPMTEIDRKPYRTWWIIAGTFAAFWLCYLYFLGPRRPSMLENTGLDRPAEYDWTLRDLNENPVRFARFQGKTVFLNVWATWCPPCVSEMPSIARLAENSRLKGRNIEFVCVSTDDTLETVRRFLRDKTWTMTILHATQLPAVFTTEGIPATFVIAPDGRIVASQVGSANWEDPEVVALLEKTASPSLPPKPSRATPNGNPG
jgi:thiol-disulfide isomerase/thioredoxin